jgi:hypothetical protein
MKVIKRLVLAVMLTVLISSTVDLPVLGNIETVQAATVKLSTKSLTLEVGQKKALKVTGTAKKITWTSNKKSVATVSNKGTITAVATGKAMITASVAGKKLTCSVVVNEPEIDYVSGAPFPATEVILDNISFVMPSDWTISPPENDGDLVIVTLGPNDTTLNSSMQLYISTSKEKDPDYEVLKGMFSISLTKEYYKGLWAENLGNTPFEITDFEQSDYETSSGKAYKIEYVISADGDSLKSVTYEGYVGGYYVQIITLDTDNLDEETIADYIFSSIVVK